MHVTRCRRSKEAAAMQTYQRTLAMIDCSQASHHTEPVAIATSPRSTQRASFTYSIENMLPNKSSAYDIDNDSDSSASLPCSFLGLGKANNSAQSSASTQLSVSELGERCLSPTEDMNRNRCHQSGLVTPNHMNRHDDWSPNNMYHDPTPCSPTSKHTALPASNQATAAAAAPKLYLPSQQISTNSNPFFSLPLSIPPRKVRSFNPLVSPAPSKSTTLSLPCKVSSQSMLPKHRDSHGKTLNFCPASSRVRPFPSNKLQLNHSRWRSEAPPPTIIGLYELKRQRDEKDEINETSEDYHMDVVDNDMSLSDISYSSAEESSSRLFDESRRWKSELIVSPSQLSLSSMPQRYSSPGRDRVR
jgi:hypothetical protein